MIYETNLSFQLPHMQYSSIAIVTQWPSDPRHLVMCYQLINTLIKKTNGSGFRIFMKTSLAYHWLHLEVGWHFPKFILQKYLHSLMQNLYFICPVCYFTVALSVYPLHVTSITFLEGRISIFTVLMSLTEIFISSLSEQTSFSQRKHNTICCLISLLYHLVVCSIVILGNICKVYLTTTLMQCEHIRAWGSQGVWISVLFFNLVHLGLWWYQQPVPVSTAQFQELAKKISTRVNNQ